MSKRGKTESQTVISDTTKFEKCSYMAAAIGRREPYHLTYIKKYGQKKTETTINTR